MCVAVTLMEQANLTLDEIQRMDRANADGVGLSWAFEGAVYWWKTTKVDPQEVHDRMVYWSNFPRLLHFRLATAGGTKPELCHPFDISEKSICTPEGSGSKVMIHNGHWGRWTEVAKLLDEEDLLPDKGPWSDSRLAAWLAHQDMDWLQALGGRVAVLEANEKITRLGDWVELRSGIMVSNKHWETSNVKRGGYQGYRTWKGWGQSDGDWVDIEKELKELEDKEAKAYKATAPTSLVSDKPPESNGKHAKAKQKKQEAKNARGRHYAQNHWFDDKTKRWFKYDQTVGALVDVTSEHTEGATETQAAGPAGAVTRSDDTEIAP